MITSVEALYNELKKLEDKINNLALADENRLIVRDFLFIKDRIVTSSVCILWDSLEIDNEFIGTVSIHIHLGGKLVGSVML